MAKPNYSFEKRQREIAKKKKNEEKRNRKLLEKTSPDAEASDETQSPVVTPGDAGLGGKAPD